MTPQHSAQDPEDTVDPAGAAFPTRAGDAAGHVHPTSSAEDADAVADDLADADREPGEDADSDAPVGPARESKHPSAGRRLMQSLSARSRGEGWEKPEGALAKYRSRWRSGLRFVLQRVIFRMVVRSAVTPQVVMHRRVKSVRGPFVLVANHTSHVDGPLLALSLPWAQGRLLSTGVATDYWFEHGWPRRFFVRTMLNAFPIDRGGDRKHSGTSRKLLRVGVPILVFPEGGRQSSGQMSSFKPGGAALAISVGVPVIPAAIVGGYEAMPKGRSWPKGRPPVRVVFGEPMISHVDESAVEFSTRIRARVKDLYDEHHDEVLGGVAEDEEESA
ncbi:MAG: 1-acyl-sn-glycerol-3-phosphate acyltransferase [Brachybacterium sp.]|nr:1-acyl-sn-glycerol-3-phosphate acyltransferase [Brachybacterium sp.]MDN5899017.1 1-acyl-sn-glycerol-3-phosphate acyltransferase [Brachybacterium sp.]